MNLFNGIKSKKDNITAYAKPDMVYKKKKCAKKGFTYSKSNAILPIINNSDNNNKKLILSGKSENKNKKRNIKIKYIKSINLISPFFEINNEYNYIRNKYKIQNKNYYLSKCKLKPIKFNLNDESNHDSYLNNNKIKKIIDIQRKTNSLANERKYIKSLKKYFDDNNREINKETEKANIQKKLKIDKIENSMFMTGMSFLKNGSFNNKENRNEMGGKINFKKLLEHLKENKKKIIKSQNDINEMIETVKCTHNQIWRCNHKLQNYCLY